MTKISSKKNVKVIRTYCELRNKAERNAYPRNQYYAGMQESYYRLHSKALRESGLK